MRLHRYQLALALFLATLTPSLVHAATQDEVAIRGVLNAQVEAWNRGDVLAFMQGYNNSPETTFVGKTVEHGFANILARYQRNFAGKEKMGQLAFDNLEVHPLDAHVAVVTGRYHLTRTANAGGDALGIFSLVFEKTPAGWKIVLDHTS
ncbi:MAG: YybH family protein [Acidobacteriaceae bacterium]